MMRQKALVKPSPTRLLNRTATLVSTQSWVIDACTGERVPELVVEIVHHLTQLRGHELLLLAGLLDEGRDHKNGARYAAAP